LLITKPLSVIRLRTIALLALSTLCAGAKAEETVLVPGRPPLTTAMTDKAAKFFEWALDLRFTPEQFEDFRAMTVRDWSTPEKRKSTLEFLPVIDKLWASPPETRERVKAQFSQALLESLNKNRSDEQARWLLAIYDRSHRENAAHPIARNSNNPGTGALTGKWRTTSVAANIRMRIRGHPHPRAATASSTNSFQTARIAATT